MEDVTCKICNQKSAFVFSAVLLKKHNVKYFHCQHCSFLQTEEPYWLDEAYCQAIGTDDTGLLKRNLLLSKRTSVIINSYFNKKSKFLDYAGGYGLFVRLMRDIGYDFYWSDLFAENLLARGFEFKNENKTELITAFECFEHFTNPIEEIDKMFEFSDSILFSTRTFHDNPPKPEEWWYYSLKNGQHVSLYSNKTLRFIADKYNLYLNSDNKSFHLLSKKKISNWYFNLLMKLSVIGLSSIVNIGMKSKTDSDYLLLSESK